MVNCYYRGQLDKLFSAPDLDRDLELFCRLCSIDLFGVFEVTLTLFICSNDSCGEGGAIEM